MSFSPDAAQGQPLGHSLVCVPHLSALVERIFSHHTRRAPRQEPAPISLIVEHHPYYLSVAWISIHSTTHIHPQGGDSKIAGFEELHITNYDDRAVVFGVFFDPLERRVEAGSSVSVSFIVIELHTLFELLNLEDAVIRVDHVRLCWC